MNWLFLFNMVGEIVKACSLVIYCILGTISGINSWSTIYIQKRPSPLRHVHKIVWSSRQPRTVSPSSPSITGLVLPLDETALMVEILGHLTSITSSSKFFKIDIKYDQIWSGSKDVYFLNKEMYFEFPASHKYVGGYDGERKGEEV